MRRRRNDKKDLHLICSYHRPAHAFFLLPPRLVKVASLSCLGKIKFCGQIFCWEYLVSFLSMGIHREDFLLMETFDSYSPSLPLLSR